jgi:phospholipase C
MNFLNDIEHVVVVMMENRSFDSVLGWLYEDSNNFPPHNIPEKAQPTFDGLLPNTFSNMHDGRKVFASHPPTPWPPKFNASLVPDPDPHEEFDHITNQVFGTRSLPPGAVATMTGFLSDYADLTESPAQIMQSFGPESANVINELARSFAVCDAWFASCPCQTWPNRGFVHTGSSDGHINNDHYELYDIDTIFNVLQARGISWGVFHDSTVIPSLTYGQFLPKLCLHGKRFYKMSSFYRFCANLDDYALPTYSFIEPRFMPEFGLFKINYPEDSHPPHNVCRAEQFLAQVYDAVRTSPYRDKIALVITYDEHGGCYDHVPPPMGAAPPEPYPVSRDGKFSFDRFGVRVPAIIISSYVRPGTVFRAPDGSPPYDHTSILASLRDWLGLTGLTNLRVKLKEWFFAKGGTKYPFLPSPRIKAAPTFWPVLSLSAPDNPWPEIKANCQLDLTDADLETRLSDVQKSLLATAKRQAVPESALAIQHETATEAKQQNTYSDALRFLHPELTSKPRSP